MPQIEAMRPSLQGGNDNYVWQPVAYGGEAGWSEQDAYEKMLQDMGMLGDAQAGADQGSFAPTQKEYQDSWTGSTDYGNWDYNYEVPGNSVDPWAGGSDYTGSNSYNYEVPGSSVDPWAISSNDSWDSYW
jgi:hypothetical protein